MRIYTHSECTEHLVPDGHSEQPNRLTTLLAHLEKTGIASELPYFEAKPIDTEQALLVHNCLLYTSPSPRDLSTSRMPSSA